MASGGAVQELCEEASCSICLDFFSDPVTIAECGHNFCRACLTYSWGEAAAQPTCPQCRAPAQEGSLRPNQQLASFVAIAQKLNLSEAEWGACEKHGEPLRLFCQEDEAPLCAVCGRSREHRGHEVMPREEAAPQKEKEEVWTYTTPFTRSLRAAYKFLPFPSPQQTPCETVVTARKKRVCQEHREPLKLFCKDHEAIICVVCEQSQEHEYHEIIPVEEASQEYKDQFCSSVETLRKERNKLLAYKASVVKESQDLLKQTKGERQKTVTKFKELHTFLDKQEELLLAQMEEVEKEVVRRKDWHLARLYKELSSLESLIQVMEEKCQQSASDLLQDASRILQRYEEKEAFDNLLVFPLALKWRIWDFSDFNSLLEGIKKQLRDTMDSEHHLQKANVTLDPNTAHPQLILSDGQKSVRMGQTFQYPHNNPERFETHGIVRGHAGFLGGHHFWEVLVGSKEEWMVGVARKSVDWWKQFTFSPKNGIWAVGRWSGKFKTTAQGHPPLSLTGELKRIRVCLNYGGGRVAFFDADRAALLYEFSGASFSRETVLPFFWVNLNGHLKIL